MMKASMIIFAVVMACGQAFCQSASSDVFGPEVQEREKLLLQGLTPAQIQAIGQSAAQFEGLAASGAAPQAALSGVLAVAGGAALDAESASFAILALAGRHLDEDLRELASGIVALNEVRQALLNRLGEISAFGGGAMGTPAAAMGMEKAMPGAVAAGKAASGVAAAAAAPCAAAMRTAYFKIEFWKAAPMATARDLRAMSAGERAMEAAFLKARLAELEGFLARMNEQAERGRLRRLQFGQEIEGLMLKMPRVRPQR